MFAKPVSCLSAQAGRLTEEIRRLGDGDAGQQLNCCSAQR